MSKPQASKRWRPKKKVKKTIEYIQKRSRMDKDFNKNSVFKQYGLKP